MRNSEIANRLDRLPIQPDLILHCASSRNSEHLMTGECSEDCFERIFGYSKTAPAGVRHVLSRIN